jgi:hypothetical protein
MADPSQDTVLNRLLERLAGVEKEREELRIAIRVIAGRDFDFSAVAGAQKSDPGEATASAANGPSRRIEIRPDKYFGLSQHQAARRYLQELGHADKLQHIADALGEGGVEIGGTSPLGTLRAVLTRDSKVFVRVGPGTFGLREFYPQLGNKPQHEIRMKGSGKKKAAKKKAGRRGRNRSKAGAASKPAVTDEPQSTADDSDE